MLILCAEVFCLPCTPDMTVSVQGPAVDRDCCFQSSQRGLAKTLDFSDSPVPPVLHTPGVKQIPRLRDAVVPSAVGSHGCMFCESLLLPRGIIVMVFPRETTDAKWEVHQLNKATLKKNLRHTPCEQ